MKNRSAFAASGITTHSTKLDARISTNWMLSPHAQQTDLFWLNPDQPSLHNKTATIQYFDSHQLPLKWESDSKFHID